MKTPVKVTVTGAAGQISYALLFRIAAGEMLGPEQPVILQLLEIPPAMKALEGVAMELEDGAFPMLADIIMSDDPDVAFDDTRFALLVGARPRGAGMERSDLLAANGGIFKIQGASINAKANREVLVLVVGNPANTNAWTCMRCAPDVNPLRFSALTRLDHNRAVAQLARHTKSAVADIDGVTIWGNHSTTQYPDLSHAKIRQQPALSLIDRAWYEDEYIPRVAKRGAEIIAARGASSAASAANAAIDHMRDWALGIDADKWTSMAVVSDGSYGVDQGLMYSFPVRLAGGGRYEVVQGLEIDAFSRQKMAATAAELREERAEIEQMLTT